MANKQILLFDIDRTLLDTEKMSDWRNEVVLKILNTEDLDKIKSVKADYRTTLKNERDYIPDEYLKTLNTELRFKDLKKLLSAYYGKEFDYIYEESVFSEVKTVLGQLNGKFRLGIFSEGTHKFQNHKFRAMNLNEYFDDDLIFINDAKDTPEVVSKIPKGAIVVDDKENICDFLFANRVKCIWLNKKDDRINDKYPTIHNLLELPKILL
jgi:FMN phosphatase YigB (HAD superfamily)